MYRSHLISIYARRSPAILRIWPLACLVPFPVWAQASPFMTGATALQTNLLAWLTPVAIILVMILGGMAMANRMSWGWCVGAIIGIAIGFGAPQIVSWVRGMFGV
ncbi:MAG TPA: TrbC/VirB2 family protein [Steroidobacteraceae bacterium]|jgi:type IV secretion system protein VirB2|nr:TrbC/VirB2 family protein [Steroidobacteraceae bacterium]